MSSETPESSSAPEQPSGEKTGRSPVERAIVWSLIGLMLVLVAIEARAQQGHTKTMLALKDLADAKDEEDRTKGIKFEDFKEKLQLFPSVSGPTTGEGWDVYVYKWVSLLKAGTYEIHVRVSSGNDINYIAGYAVPLDGELMFEAVGPPEGAMPPPTEDDGMPDGGMQQGMPNAGGPAPGGGNGPEGNERRRFDPAQIFAARDENADGKLSGEELEGRIADRVAELDTNKDGEISKEEFDAGFGAFRGPRGEGGAPNGPGSRPPVDDSTEKDSTEKED